MSTSAANLEILASAATATAAVFAVWIAWEGLGTWRKQLSWQSNNDLARRILVKLFRYRDSLEQLADPWIFAGELHSKEVDELETDDEELRDYDATHSAYQRRLHRVTDAKSELYSELLEAEAIWGSKLKELFQPIEQIELKIFKGIRSFLRFENPRLSKTKRNAAEQLFRQKYETFLWPELHNEKPHSELEVCVAEIENYLREKLSSEKSM